MGHSMTGVTVPSGNSGRWLVEADPTTGGTRLRSDEGTWMTDDVAERDTLTGLLGRVEDGASSLLMTGLGLGLVLTNVLRFDHVRRIDVVEIEEDVISLVAPHYADERVHIHHACAFCWEPDGQWDLGWHDVWLSASPNYLSWWATLRDRYAPYVGWQSGWLVDQMNEFVMAQVPIPCSEENPCQKQ